MASDITAMLTVARRRDIQRRGPSPRARLLLYGAAWLPPLILLFALFPPIDPFFQRLIDEKAAPKVTRSLATFVSLNESSHYLLAVVAALALLLADEAVLRLMHRWPLRPRWAWLWVAGVALAGLSGWAVLHLGLSPG
jgi:hypothetical protein